MSTEAEFIAAIDCRFPYADARRAEALIDQASAISANAVFMVVHELSRWPAAAEVDAASCLGLLDRLAARFEHPLAEHVLHAARRMIARDPLPTAECLALMGRIARLPGQYCALAVAAFACEDAGMELAGRLHDEILTGWNNPAPGGASQEPGGEG